LFEDGNSLRIFPDANWKSKELPDTEFKVDPNYMIAVFESITEK